MIEEGITESLQKSRYMVVAVDKETGRLRVKGEAEACRDLSCHAGTRVVTDEETRADLGCLNPGDIIRVNEIDGRPAEVVVLRRAWEELTSPEM